MPPGELVVGVKVPKIQGRVVLRADVVKGPSGLYAVFTEQGSSASKMSAASVLDVISQTGKVLVTSKRSARSFAEPLSWRFASPTGRSVP